MKQGSKDARQEGSKQGSERKEEFEGRKELKGRKEARKDRKEGERKEGRREEGKEAHTVYYMSKK